MVKKSKKKEFSKDSAQKEKKVCYRERKEKLLNFLQQAGSWILPRAIAEQIAKECNVSERQVYKDRLKVIRSIPKPDVQEVAGKFLINCDFAMLQAIALMRSDDSMAKAKGVDLYFKSIDVFTKFLENFGFKERVAEKLDLNVKDYVFKIIIQKEGDGNAKPKSE